MEEHKVYSYRWVVVALFWLVIFAFGTNWFALSPMLTTFEKQFSVQPWESHLLISLIGMFVIFFAWPAGALIDKRGPKLTITIGALFMAIGFGIRPWMTQSFLSLMVTSIIAGIGLAWILVALAPQMMRWFPARSAGLPIGIAASGLFLGFGTGSLLTPLLAPSATTASDFYFVFLIFGIMAIITFILWVIAAKDHPATPPEDRPAVQKMGFATGMKHVFSSKNAYLYPLIGFFIVGVTLVISAFTHSLYSTTPDIKKQGGYIAGFLLYGCALGAFVAPFAAKKYGLKKITLTVIIGATVMWIILFGLFSSANYMVASLNWLLIVVLAFIFGVFFQASWPLALYSQETEQGVSEANVGIAASLYVSISNVGAAIVPVVYPILFAKPLPMFVAILASILICLILWLAVKRR